MYGTSATLISVVRGYIIIKIAQFNYDHCHKNNQKLVLCVFKSILTIYDETILKFQI